MSQPRIIAGRAKGLRLIPVPGETTRPITDRVKEALFNIINQDIIDARLLDLFGGTGSVGIEALSRGAGFVQFVELHSQVVKVLRENLQRSKLDTSARVQTGDSFAFLKKYDAEPFDYIFIAPPQYKDMWRQALEIIDSKPQLVIDDGWLIVQIHPIEYKGVSLSNFKEFDQRKYGSTLLIFYEKILLDQSNETINLPSSE